MADTKFIVPKEIDTNTFSKNIVAGVPKITEFLRREMDKLVSNWNPENKPVWDVLEAKFVGGNLLVEFSTESTPFIYVLGTKPHRIAARNSNFLHFKGSFGWVKTFEVMHPGIDPKLYGDKFDKILDDASEMFDKLVVFEINAIEGF